MITKNSITNGSHRIMDEEVGTTTYRVDEITQNKIDSMFESLGAVAAQNNYINPELYGQYNVKMGLRNSDGTGVLAGLTEIGDVHAYEMQENVKIPVNGKLIYRGIDTFDIVSGFQKDKRFGFEECCYLLLFGLLPNEKQLEEFTWLLSEHRDLPNGFTRDLILKAPSKNIMNKLARTVLSAYSYDDNADDTSITNVLRQSIELIARFPTLAAHGYQAYAHFYEGKSLYIHNPRHDLSTSENILHMIRPDSKYTRSEAEILDLALVLHAEHGGGNNSTFTIHVVSSTATDTYSAIAAALGSLKGPKHGGANIKVMQMMDNIIENINDWEDDDEIRAYLEKIMKKQAFDGSGLIYGMGHAVYTLSDPRAVLLKEKAGELAAEQGHTKEFKLFEKVEMLAPGVFQKIKKTDKLISANVDFYSGFVYKMLGIPMELYTPIFAIARVVGWCAHILEELVDGSKIMRPAYKNVCPKKEYVSINER